MESQKIVILTAEQIQELIDDAVERAISKGQRPAETDATSTKRYVYGLRGIADLFGVSIITAQKYKDSIIADAVIQRGRKIMTDADKALELFNQAKAS